MPIRLVNSHNDQRPYYTRAEIDPCAAGDTESNVGRVRLLGYRVGAPNAGLPAGKNAYCEPRFLQLQKVETGREETFEKLELNCKLPQ